MSYKQRITELERKVNILYNMIHSLVSPVYIEGLKCFREECEKRFTKLEKRFDAANASSKGSVLDVCKMQAAIIRNINKAREVFEQVDNTKEDRDYISSCDTVEHKNVFRIIDRSIREIPSGLLPGLKQIMREYESTSLFECFKDCDKLTRIDFPRNFTTGNVTDMSAMFHGCSSLTSLDLSTFNTSRVTDMSSMFKGCSSLSSLDLSTFNTSSVTSVYFMFGGCISLTSLNLSSFNTSSVICMLGMFGGCKSLSLLDLSSFDTSNVTDMACMFYGCDSLTSLNLSSFNTSSVISMFCMFGGCKSLSSLDLSRFDTSNVTNMSDMFYGCGSLSSLNLSTFNARNVTSMSGMFYGCHNLYSLECKDPHILSALKGQRIDSKV